MFCSNCGAELVASGAFCAACGVPMGVRVEQPQLTRPGVITFLAVLQFGAAIWLLAGLVTLGATVLGDGTDSGASLVAAVLLGGLGLLQLTCGIGLWKLKRYGRILQLVFAFIGLLGVPIGTIISILILVYLYKPGISALFSGKTISEFTPAELVEIASVTQGSQSTTILVVALGVVAAIVGIGIIAAIAVPGLLRARMAGNEASAIGSLRAINSAEASYSSAAASGGYAVSLVTLSTPCPGSAQGFISTDLSQDPSIKSGYLITLASAGAAAGPLDCGGVPTESSYYATAVPVTFGASGSRTFSTSSAGTIFFDSAGTAPSRGATLAGSATALQ
jgi:type IV pilus assembly protein PilA